jgi:hypothetical protein
MTTHCTLSSGETYATFEALEQKVKQLSEQDGFRAIKDVQKFTIAQSQLLFALDLNIDCYYSF